MQGKPLSEAKKAAIRTDRRWATIVKGVVYNATGVATDDTREALACLVPAIAEDHDVTVQKVARLALIDAHQW